MAKHTEEKPEPTVPTGRRVVDTAAYISMLRELTEEGNEVPLLISGNSMSPFLIHDRDTIRFKKPDRPLRVGDMVFFQRDNGRFVMHRIWKRVPAGYMIVGDAQTVPEGPIREDQIFGLVTGVCRKGRWIAAGNFWWGFFAHVWIRILRPRRWIIGLYERLRRIGSSKK